MHFWVKPKPEPHISEGKQQLLNQGSDPVLLHLGEGLEVLIMGLRRCTVHPV